MNSKKSILIVLLITCTLAGQIYTIHADDYRPHLEVTTANTTFAAGSKGDLNITLHNGGNFDATEIEAMLSSTTPGITPLTSSQKVFNKIATGESVSYTVSVMVDQNVAVGAYIMTLNLGYLRGGYGLVTVMIPLSIIVNQPALPAVKITTSNNKITPGATNKLHLTAQNINNANISNLEISLSSATPLISISDSVNYQINKLDAGNSLNFDTSIIVFENTPIGVYSLTAQVWYLNDFGVTLRQTIIIPLEVSAVAVTRTPVVTITNLTPSTVYPGEEFNFKIEVQCADAAIYNAKATLGLDPTGLISPISPTTLSLGDLGVNISSKLTYVLLIKGSASAADIPLTMSIKYLDSKGVQGTVTETITVPVEDIVKFSLMKDATIIAEKGATTTFEGDLLLVGTGKVKFATIGVAFEEPTQQVTGSTEYIGAIDPDSPVPFSLQFKVNNNTAIGNYNLNLKITYLNSRNIEQNKTISVPLQVVNSATIKPTTSNDSGIWGWIKRLFGLQ